MRSKRDFTTFSCVQGRAWIYAAQMDKGLNKVGFTKDLDDRLKHYRSHRHPDYKFSEMVNAPLELAHRADIEIRDLLETQFTRLSDDCFDASLNEIYRAICSIFDLLGHPKLIFVGTGASLILAPIEDGKPKISEELAQIKYPHPSESRGDYLLTTRWSNVHKKYIGLGDAWTAAEAIIADRMQGDLRIRWSA